MKLDGFTLVSAVLAVASAGFAGVQAVSAPPVRQTPAPQQAQSPGVDGEAVASVLGRMVAPPRTDTQLVERPNPLRDLRLIGVMETDQGRVAVLDDDGQMRTLRVGQSAHGLDIIAIDPSLVVIRFDGEEHRLSLGEL